MRAALILILLLGGRAAAGNVIAGGELRLSPFDWIALDLEAGYQVEGSVTLRVRVPLAVEHPEQVALGTLRPKSVGGVMLRLDAMQPHPGKVAFGLMLEGGTMRERAMLLGDKDIPLYAGDFAGGLAVGAIATVALSATIDLRAVPSWLHQGGATDSVSAFQIPLAIRVALGSITVAAQTGLFTGDDYALGGAKGGRLAMGGWIERKLGPIVIHADAGVASLLTGGMYPTIGESLYVGVGVACAE